VPLSSARTAGQTLSRAELTIGGRRGHTIYGPAGLYEGTLAGAERPDAAGDGGRPASVRDRAASASGALALDDATRGPRSPRVAAPRVTLLLRPGGGHWLRPSGWAAVPWI